MMEMKNVRRALEDMEGSAMVRRNMGEYAIAESLHRWARTLKGAVLADEKELECPSRESTSKSSSTSDTSTS